MVNQAGYREDHITGVPILLSNAIDLMKVVIYLCMISQFTHLENKAKILRFAHR